MNFWIYPRTHVYRAGVVGHKIQVNPCLAGVNDIYLYSWKRLLSTTYFMDIRCTVFVELCVWQAYI